MPTRNLTASKSTLLAKTGGTALGGGQDKHLPVGYYAGYRFRAMIKFTMDWTDVTQITKAELFLKTTGQVHVSFGADPDIRIGRLSGSFSPNSDKHASEGGSGWSTAPANYDSAPSITGSTFDKDVTTSGGTWLSKDITTLFDNWAPPEVKTSTGADGPGDTTESTEFYSMRNSSGKPYIKLTYTSTVPPSVPINLSPTGGVILTDTTPDFEYTHRDEDGDRPDYSQVQVDDDSGFGSAIWDNEDGPYFYPGGDPEEYTLSMTYAGSALTRGTVYYWRARTSDETDGYGGWTAAQAFQINQLPTTSGGDLSNSRIVEIHNLNDASAWSGSEAKPKFYWTFADADGDSQAEFQVQVGTTIGNNDVADSGAVASTNGFWECSAGVPRDTIRYWRVNVKDSRGEWSGWSTSYTFKVQWAQSIYEQSVTGGTSSSQWQFDASITGDSAVIFSSATGSNGSGRSSWSSTIGAVSPNAYLNVLVRLGAGAGGVNSSIYSMDFDYVASGLTPDNWAFSGQGTADWVLDSDTRRYGSRSLKYTNTQTATGWAIAEPYRLTSGDGVPVTPGTTYTYSAFVRTDGVLSHGTVGIELKTIGGSVVASHGLITDTTEYDGGWQRLSDTWLCPPGTYAIKTFVVYTHNDTSTGDTIWVDALKLEEGTVASAWTPGFISKASIIDAMGLQIDGVEGGIMRLRTSGGETIEMDADGLKFGDGGTISEGTTNEIDISGLLKVNSNINMTGNIYSTATNFVLEGQGSTVGIKANSKIIYNDGSQFYVSGGGMQLGHSSHKWTNLWLSDNIYSDGQLVFGVGNSSKGVYWDSDTGLQSTGDGNIRIIANNVVIAEVEPTSFVVNKAFVGTHPMVRRSVTTESSSTGSWNVVNFTATDTDEGGVNAFTTTSNYLTELLIAGWYRFTWKAHFTGNGSGNRRQSRLSINGTGSIPAEFETMWGRSAGSSVANGTPGSAVRYMAANDTVQMGTMQNSGGGLTVTSVLVIEYMGPAL